MAKHRTKSTWRTRSPSSTDQERMVLVFTRVRSEDPLERTGTQGHNTRRCHSPASKCAWVLRLTPCHVPFFLPISPSATRRSSASHPVSLKSPRRECPRTLPVSDLTDDLLHRLSLFFLFFSFRFPFFPSVCPCLARPFCRLFFS